MVDLEPVQNGGMADFKANAMAIAIAFQAASVSGVDVKSGFPSKLRNYERLWRNMDCLLS